MPELKSYLPERLCSPAVEDFEDAFQPRLEEIAETFFDLTEKELFAASAEKWLPLWEAAYGIPSDEGKSLADRRSRLLSKLRGAGTTTPEQIRQAVSAFANSDCEIIERAADYAFDIRFVGVYGIPPNIADVKAAVEEIKPAHLAYQLLYVFHCWQDYAAQTWSSASTKTWAEMKG